MSDSALKSILDAIQADLEILFPSVSVLQKRTPEIRDVTPPVLICYAGKPILPRSGTNASFDIHYPVSVLYLYGAAEPGEEAAAMDAAFYAQQKILERFSAFAPGFGAWGVDLEPDALDEAWQKLVEAEVYYSAVTMTVKARLPQTETESVALLAALGGGLIAPLGG